MTERENLLLLLQHGTPEWVPLFGKAINRVIPSCVDETCLLTGGGKSLFGVYWTTSETAGVATTPDTSKPPVIGDISHWEDFFIPPDVEQMDWEGCAKKDLEKIDRHEKLLYTFGIVGVFDHLLTLCGSEDGLCAIYEEPDAVKRLFEAMTEYRIGIIRKLQQFYHLDVWVDNDDVATANDLFISPQMYREFVWPYEKRVNDAAREAGMIVQHHCCGKCESIVPDFIASGCASWEPAQSLNDIAGILKKYGNKLSVIGGWDSSGPCSMESATVEDVIAETERCLREYAVYGHYALFPVLLGNTRSELYQEKMRAIEDVHRTYIKHNM